MRQKAILAVAILFALHEHGVETQESGGQYRLQDLAREIGVSTSYAEVVASTLREHEWIEGLRGPGGGYWLAKPLRGICLDDIQRLFRSSKTPSTEIQDTAFVLERHPSTNLEQLYREYTERRRARDHVPSERRLPREARLC